MKRPPYHLLVLLATSKTTGQTGRKIRKCVKQICPSRWWWMAWIWNWTTNGYAGFYETLRSLENDRLVCYVPIPGRAGVWGITHKGALYVHDRLPETDVHCDIFEILMPGNE